MGEQIQAIQSKCFKDMKVLNTWSVIRSLESSHIKQGPRQSTLDLGTSTPIQVRRFIFHPAL